jgi:hypothetical protein
MAIGLIQINPENGTEFVLGTLSAPSKQLKGKIVETYQIEWKGCKPVLHYRCRSGKRSMTQRYIVAGGVHGTNSSKETMGDIVILYWNEVAAKEMRVEIKYARSTRSEVLFKRAVRETK